MSRHSIPILPKKGAGLGAERKLLVGNVEVLALTDGEQPYPLTLDQLFPTVSAEAWAAFHKICPETFAKPNRWHGHIGSFLLHSQGRNILVDTGKGPSVSSPGIGNTFGGARECQLIGQLEAAGVSPKEIDIVFLTHLHPDHVGWNLSQISPRPKASFPWARYVINRADWETFKRADIQHKFPFPYWEEALGPLEKLGVLDLIEGEQALTGEISAFPTPGHTPGHMSLAIGSEGQRGYVIGDLAIHPAQLTETEWCDSWTMEPRQAEETRRRFINRAATENATLIAGHFPPPGFGRLIRKDGQLYWQAL